jgi:hypothetical protein
MIRLVWPADLKSDRNILKKSLFAHSFKVATDLKDQFVLASNHLLWTEQRSIGSTIQIRNRGFYEFPGVAVQLPKLHRNAGSGSPERDIDYVRGKSSFHLTRSASRNLAILEISLNAV